MTDAPHHEEEPERRRRWPTWLLVTLALLAVPLTLVTLGLGLLVAAFYVPPAPAARHLRGVDVDELLRTTDALCADPSRHGLYWDPTAKLVGRPPTPDPSGPPPLAVSLLPAALRDLHPLRVSIGEGGVSLMWADDPAYGYGYTLTLFRTGQDDSHMLDDNGNYHHTEKVRDRIWSNYQFH